jgi:hypothetical protein
MATLHEMTAVEVSTSDIKRQIDAGASDMKNFMRVGASAVVAQLTAEVHDVSLKLDAFKFEHDVQNDMQNAELHLLHVKLDAQTRLLNRGFWLMQVMLMIIWAQSMSHFQWNIDEVSFPGWRPDFVRRTPKTPWGVQEKYMGAWDVGLVNATKVTAEAAKEDANLRFVAEGLIWDCDWFLMVD